MVNDCGTQALGILIDRPQWRNTIMAIDTPENEFVADYFLNFRRYAEWCLCLWRLKVGATCGRFSAFFIHGRRSSFRRNVSQLAPIIYPLFFSCLS